MASPSRYDYERTLPEQPDRPWYATLVKSKAPIHIPEYPVPGQYDYDPVEDYYDDGGYDAGGYSSKWSPNPTDAPERTRTYSYPESKERLESKPTLRDRLESNSSPKKGPSKDRPEIRSSPKKEPDTHLGSDLDTESDAGSDWNPVQVHEVVAKVRDVQCEIFRLEDRYSFLQDRNEVLTGKMMRLRDNLKASSKLGNNDNILKARHFQQWVSLITDYRFETQMDNMKFHIDECQKVSESLGTAIVEERKAAANFEKGHGHVRVELETVLTSCAELSDGISEQQERMQNLMERLRAAEDIIGHTRPQAQHVSRHMDAYEDSKKKRELAAEQAQREASSPERDVEDLRKVRRSAGRIAKEARASQQQAQAQVQAQSQSQPRQRLPPQPLQSLPSSPSFAQQQQGMHQMPPEWPRSPMTQPRSVSPMGQGYPAMHQPPGMPQPQQGYQAPFNRYYYGPDYRQADPQGSAFGPPQRNVSPMQRQVTPIPMPSQVSCEFGPHRQMSKVSQASAGFVQSPSFMQSPSHHSGSPAMGFGPQSPNGSWAPCGSSPGMPSPTNSGVYRPPLSPCGSFSQPGFQRQGSKVSRPGSKVSLSPSPNAVARAHAAALAGQLPPMEAEDSLMMEQGGPSPTSGPQFMQGPNGEVLEQWWCVRKPGQGGQAIVPVRQGA